MNILLKLQEMERIAYIENSPLHSAISELLDAVGELQDEAHGRGYALGHQVGVESMLQPE